MNIDFISFSQRGAAVAVSAANVLEKDYHSVRVYCLNNVIIGNCTPFDDIQKQTEKSFQNADGIIFISECSTAVSACAPFLNKKNREPSVAVLDEDVKYIVPLISGSIGGANKLAEIIAKASGAKAIIFNPSFSGEFFEPEKFIRKNNLSCDNKKLLKEITSEIYSNKPIGFSTSFSHSRLPEILKDGFVFPVPEYGICVSVVKTGSPFKKTLYLIPKAVTIGISCKKGTPFQKIENHIMTALSENRIPLYSVEALAGVNFKKNEEGINEFCELYHLPFETYPPEEIASYETREETDSVCERCAMMRTKGNLIVKKNTDNGITTAMAVKDVYLEM